MKIEFGKTYRTRNGFVGELAPAGPGGWGILKGEPKGLLYDTQDEELGNFVYPLTGPVHEHDIVEEVVSDKGFQLTLTKKEAEILLNLLYRNVCGYDGIGGHRDTLDKICGKLESMKVDKDSHSLTLGYDNSANYG